MPPRKKRGRPRIYPDDETRKEARAQHNLKYYRKHDAEIRKRRREKYLEEECPDSERCVSVYAVWSTFLFL